MKKDIWGDEDWEKDTSNMNLWTIDFGNRCTVWAVTGNVRIMDVDERKDGTCVCDENGDKDEDGYDAGWSEDMINGTGRLLSDCNWTRTHNHLVHKQTLNHLAKLAKWLSCVVSTYLYGAFDCMFLSCHVRVSEWIHTL